MLVNIRWSDENIINAVQKAGCCQCQFSVRRGMRPKPGDRNQRRWVTPRELGYCVCVRLLLRLRRLTEYGCLECLYISGQPFFRVPQTFRFS